MLWTASLCCNSQRKLSCTTPTTIFLFSSLCSALYLSMKDTEKGVKELNLEKDKKIFNHCFTGKRSYEFEKGKEAPER